MLQLSNENDRTPAVKAILKFQQPSPRNSDPAEAENSLRTDNRGNRSEYKNWNDILEQNVPT